MSRAMAEILDAMSVETARMMRDNDDTGHGLIWIGSLSGYQLEASIEDRILLYHRCGWKTLLDGITGMLGNAIELALLHRETGCLR